MNKKTRNNKNVNKKLLNIWLFDFDWIVFFFVVCFVSPIQIWISTWWHRYASPSWLRSYLNFIPVLHFLEFEKTYIFVLETAFCCVISNAVFNRVLHQRIFEETQLWISMHSMMVNHVFVINNQLKHVFHQQQLWTFIIIKHSWNIVSSENNLDICLINKRLNICEQTRIMLIENTIEAVSSFCFAFLTAPG